MTRFVEITTHAIASIEESVREIRESNARTDRQLLAMQQQAEKDRERADRDREQAEKERKDFNRRLAEITDAQGLLIENMVWPNLKRIATQAFGGEEPLSQMIRYKRVHPATRSRSKEYDLLAVCSSAVLVCEAKSKPTPEKVKEFLESLQDFKEFFPEYRDLRVIPMVASIYFDENVVSFMTRLGVLALGFGDETMDLLNPEAANKAGVGGS